MKGYKGFEKGLICRGKQYAENTVFEEEKAAICNCGMHFCENPLDVLDYYPLLDENGEHNDFAEVEALADVKTDDGKKYCTTKLKVGAKLSFAGLVKASVAFALEKIKTDGGYYAQLAASGYSAKLAASGDSAKLAASGYYAKLAASGHYAQLAASGYSAKLAASGDSAQLAASGHYAQLAASGDYAKLAASGDAAQLAASGDAAQLAASGDSAKLAASGDSAKLAASGDYAKLAASGDYAKLAASGDSAKLAASGSGSIVAGIGLDSIAKASCGCWITLAEWGWSSEKGRFVPVCVKTEYVDGERIKADTFYRLKDGEFVECQ